MEILLDDLSPRGPEGYERTSASAFDFEALLDTPSDLQRGPLALLDHAHLGVSHHASAADFEALLADDDTPVRNNKASLADDVTPTRSNQMFQLAEWAWQDSPKQAAVCRKDILPLPAGVGAISRALPKRSKLSAALAKPASKKAKPMKAMKEKQMKPASKKVKPAKTAKKMKGSPKLLSHTRHCTVSRAYKQSKREACEIKCGPGCFYAGSLLSEPISICNQNEPSDYSPKYFTPKIAFRMNSCLRHVLPFCIYNNTVIDFSFLYIYIYTYMCTPRDV